MGSHNVHGKKEERKRKKGSDSANQSPFSTRPVFEMPKIIPKVRKSE